MDASNCPLGKRRANVGLKRLKNMTKKGIFNITKSMNSRVILDIFINKKNSGYL